MSAFPAPGALPGCFRSATLRIRRAAPQPTRHSPSGRKPRSTANPVIFAVPIGRVKSVLTGLLLALAAAGGLACSPRLQPGVYNADSQTPLAYELREIRGVRDGDRMEAAVEFTHPDGSTLSLRLHLAIGVPTSLRTGTYRRSGTEAIESGEVRARSLTFLGGQSDWPNVGGSFELLNQGRIRYLVRFPPTPVNPTP